MSVGLRKDRTEHGSDELAYVKHRTVVDGVEAPALTREVNAKFHAGLPVRTIAAIRMMRTKHGWNVNPTPDGPAPKPVEKEQEVKREETADGLSFLAIGRRIKTLEDLIAHVGLDLTKYEVHEPAATSWDVTLRDPETGEPKTVQNHRIAFKARPKTGPNLQEQVEAIIAGAFKSRKPLPTPKAFPKSGLMQSIVIADPHIGKLSWSRETRAGDYDLNIADEVLRAGIAHLRNMGDVAVRHFWLLGDVFHYDTPNGTTTKGTPLDRDGRVQKMIEVGASVLCDALEESAKEVPTVVTLVPGNHDTILTYALQRILQSHFRHTKSIQIDGGYETRKYIQWGQCLVGLTHGDKAVKVLPSLMAREAALEWGQTTHRVIHKGHLHSRRSVESIEGVTLYQHPALCPPDGWHASEGYIAERGMESHVYHSGGATTAMRFYAPDLGRPVSKGTR